MAAKKFIRVALTALLTLALVVSVFPICAFATDDVVSVSTDDVAEDLLGAVANDAEELEGEVEEIEGEVEEVESEAADALEDAGEVIDAADILGEDDAAEDDAAEENGENDAAAEDDKKISTGTIVSIAIVALIVIIAAVYCIKNREKVAKFFRECKSELKKIVWTPWKQVKKNAVVVIIIVIICAVIIGVLDFVFSKGIIALGDLF